MLVFRGYLHACPWGMLVLTGPTVVALSVVPWHLALMVSGCWSQWTFPAIAENTLLSVHINPMLTYNFNKNGILKGICVTNLMFIYNLMNFHVIYSLLCAYQSPDYSHTTKETTMESSGWFFSVDNIRTFHEGIHNTSIRNQ